jgi:Flp pilus assembly protein TadD
MVPPALKKVDDGRELEDGLLALESGSADSALELLRRATFREPENAVAQFALGRAYVATGDPARARTALLQTRRLLAPLSGDEFLAGSDSLSVETVRQTVRTYLEELGAP